MRRRLYLLRHAKSSWKQLELADHDRPLAGRGRRAAAVIARHLEQQQIAPELVLCSTARRARETYEGMKPVLRHASVRHEPRLYRASAHELLRLLHAVPDEVSTVMVIGHNPAIEQLALILARPAAALDELRAKFPTAALATLELDAGWHDLQLGGTTLIAFTRPADLDH